MFYSRKNQIIYVLVHVFECHPPQYLGLCQSQLGSKVGPLRQGKVLGLLEALVESLELQAGVNGPRLPDLLPLSVQPHLPIFDYCRGLLVV